MEEGAYRFLAACRMILFGALHPTICRRPQCLVRAHPTPQFAAVPLVLPDAFHASDLLPPKMRIHFGEILNQASICTDNPTRNLASDGADSAVRKIALKSPNITPDQALLKDLQFFGDSAGSLMSRTYT